MTRPFWPDSRDLPLTPLHFLRNSKVNWMSTTAISSVPLIPAVKHMVARLHGDAAFERVLPPHLPLTAEQKATLAAIDLDAIVG